MRKAQNKQKIHDALDIITSISPRFRFAPDALAWSFFPYFIFIRQAVRDPIEFIYMVYHELSHMKFMTVSRLWYLYQRCDLLSKILFEIVFEQGCDPDGLSKVAWNIRSNLRLMDYTGQVLEETFALGSQLIDRHWEEKRWKEFERNPFSLPATAKDESDWPSQSRKLPKEQFVKGMKRIRNRLLMLAGNDGKHGLAVQLAMLLLERLERDVEAWFDLLIIANRIKMNAIDVIQMSCDDVKERIKAYPFDYSRDFRLIQLVKDPDGFMDLEKKTWQNPSMFYDMPPFSTLVANAPIPDGYKEIVISRFRKYYSVDPLNEQVMWWAALNSYKSKVKHMINWLKLERSDWYGVSLNFYSRKEEKHRSESPRFDGTLIEFLPVTIHRHDRGFAAKQMHLTFPLMINDLTHANPLYIYEVILGHPRWRRIRELADFFAEFIPRFDSRYSSQEQSRLKLMAGFLNYELLCIEINQALTLEEDYSCVRRYSDEAMLELRKYITLARELDSPPLIERNRELFLQKTIKRMEKLTKDLAKRKSQREKDFLLASFFIQ